jgi:DNA-binding transcriptional LysR family regulator
MPSISMEISSNETIKQAVIAGMGLSLPVTAHAGAWSCAAACWQLLEIAGTPVMRTWNVVHLQSRTLSPLAEAFRYFLIEHGEQHLLAHDTPLLAPDAAAEDSRFATSL